MEISNAVAAASVLIAFVSLYYARRDKHESELIEPVDGYSKLVRDLRDEVNRMKEERETDLAQRAADAAKLKDLELKLGRLGWVLAEARAARRDHEAEQRLWGVERAKLRSEVATLRAEVARLRALNGAAVDVLHQDNDQQ